MYTVETYTIKNGSNMDSIEYRNIPIKFIAKDLMNYDNWDYAYVYGDNDMGIASIHKENGKPVINWDWDEIV